MREVFVSTICTLAFGVLPAPAASEPVDPAGIDALFAEVDAAFAARDAESILNRFSDHYLSDVPPMTKGLLRESLKSLCGSEAPIVSRHELREKLVNGDRALVVARHELRVGSEVEVSDVHYRLSAASGAWRIVSRTMLPANAAPPAPGEPFEIKAFGLRVNTPEQWHLYLSQMPAIAGDEQAALRMESPDLGASMSICVVNMPVPVAPKELAAIWKNSISALIPDSKFETPCVSQKNGESEIQIVWKQPCSEYAQTSKIVIRQQDSRVMVASLVAHADGAANRYEPAFESLLESLTLTEPQALPPDQGRIEGDSYVNDVYGCAATFPAGWKLTQIRAFSFCTLAESSDGSGSVTFAGFRLPQPFGAAELIEADDAMTAELDETFKRLERAAVRIGEQEWETSLSLTAAGGADRKRLRLYTVRGNVLYFFICDAVPPERFDEHRRTFEATVETLRLQDPKFDVPATDQSMLANPKDRRGSKD